MQITRTVAVLALILAACGGNTPGADMREQLETEGYGYALNGVSDAELEEIGAATCGIASQLQTETAWIAAMDYGADLHPTWGRAEMSAVSTVGVRVQCPNAF